MKIKNRRQVSLLILLMAHMLTIVDIFIVNIAIPSIQDGLDAAHAEVQLVVAMYMIGFASFLIIGGKAGDHYGRKRILLLGLFFFMLSSVCCGLAQTSGQLILSRFFQGVSAGLMSPQVLSYMQVLFKDHKERTYAIGWYGIAIGIGTMLGQFLGGFLVELNPIVVDQSWRYIFLINIPVCAVTMLFANKFLPLSKDRFSLKMDYSSACLLSIGLVTLILSLTIGLEQDSCLVGTLLTISLVLLLCFFVRQKQRKKKQKEPLLDLALFRYGNFKMGIFAVAIFMLMLDGYFFVLAIFLQDGLRLSPIEAGYFIVFQGGGFILASSYSAGLILRFGKNVLIVGTAMIICALILQLLLFYYQNTGIANYAVMTVHGIGVALVLPSLANIALKGLPENMIGNASGVYSTLQQLSGALGIALTGGVFYYVLNDNVDFTNFYKAFTYVILIHIFCLIVILLILSRLPQSILPQRAAKHNNQTEK
ncbi:MFS transporter [Flavobacterium sp. HJSW_4]|uniref:MFS transporter n=1 Tax=Flavobacterium sp. HJSW_4 TaxID=3344660 RepID=UPI0035F4FC7D